jgi:hypothetical protein
MLDRDALRAEALRIHARYVVEVVEGLGFCPWARAAREQGRLQTRVVLDAESTADAAVEQVRALDGEPDCEIGLLVFPQLALGRLAFQHFAAAVRAGYEAHQGPSPFAIADFHPDAAPNFDSAAELVPFIRRSPDPSLQLVRRAALAAVRLGDGPGTRFVDPSVWLENEALHPQPAPLHERVAGANLRQVQALGVEHVLALLADIERDRDASYARLGLLPPPWRAQKRELDDQLKQA